MGITIASASLNTFRFSLLSLKPVKLNIGSYEYFVPFQQQQPLCTTSAHVKPDNLIVTGTQFVN